MALQDTPQEQPHAGMQVARDLQAVNCAHTAHRVCTSQPQHTPQYPPRQFASSYDETGSQRSGVMKDQMIGGQAGTSRSEPPPPPMYAQLPATDARFNSGTVYSVPPCSGTTLSDMLPDLPGRGTPSVDRRVASNDQV